MPDYVYKYIKCNIQTIKTRSIIESEPQYNCDICNVVLTRQYTPFGVQFNGKGFYSTDNNGV
jgi:predicted nucleic acid-binding Zn ribbon protein